MSRNIEYIKFSWINWVEGSIPVIHFFILFMSESDEFENLPTNRASLKGSFSKHEHHKLVLFVIVLILETSAANIAEWCVSSENDGRVIDRTKVDCLDVIEVIVDL